MGLYTSTHNDTVKPARPLRAAMAGAHAGPDRRQRAPRRLSQREPGQRQGALADGRAGGQGRRADPPGWFDQWADATFATDAVGAKQSPPVLRAPNGVVADSKEYWQAGKPLYDPGEIRVPVLIIHAEWDADLPSYRRRSTSPS